jgi:DNA modification methylase
VRPCLLAGTAEGDTVLDPFFGSGTVGEVARSLGRDFVGLELNPEYVEIARQRLHDRAAYDVPVTILG